MIIDEQPKSPIRNLVIDGADGHGLVIHKGVSAELINPRISGCRLRGIQFDAGAKRIVIRGGHIYNNGNDGIGGEGGRWFIAGLYCYNNGLDGQDSRDDIQITLPEIFEITWCRLETRRNANIIIRPGPQGGRLLNNDCTGRRHCLALEGEYASEVQGSGNVFRRGESGIFTYGKKSPGFRAHQWEDRNKFIGCKHRITEEWD